MRELIRQFLLVHIMLILTDTKSLGINLNKFCQRILQTTCHGSRRSLSDVEVRELFCCKGRCRVYGCTCLVNDNILHLHRNLM